MKMKDSIVKNALLGLSVGDALGVPVEFLARHELLKEPVTGMREFGSHPVPAGTWSDDSSLTFCLAESLCKGYDLNDIGNNFVKWCYGGFWTPHGNVFDIGMTTGRSIDRIKKGIKPEFCGEMDEYSNGNGSLMRVLPLAFYIKDLPLTERYKMVKEVSSLTHAHVRSVLACFIYLEYAIHLLNGKNKSEAYHDMQETVNSFLAATEINPAEIERFERILKKDISTYEESKIYGSGYVIHTLEASLWCLLVSDNYKDSVLKAVNLGEDTDTTAAVTGGLAGILYGIDQIPPDWLDALARKDDIIHLAERLEMSLKSK
jgi:ADP-ribosyl-[dinitrogen reductase] hydrolase